MNPLSALPVLNKPGYQIIVLDPYSPYQTRVIGHAWQDVSHIGQTFISGLWIYQAIGFERFVITLGILGDSLYTRRFSNFRIRFLRGLSICSTKTKSKANPTTSPTKNQSIPIFTP